MNEESITIRVLVTLQSSMLMPTVCSVVFCSICSLLCSGITIFKHERAELWELKMLISDWFIFNWSQGPVPRPCSHEGPSKILRGPVPATGPTNSNQFEFLGPISGTKIQSLRPDFWRKLACSHGGTWSQGLVPATGPCDQSPHVWRPLQISHTVLLYRNEHQLTWCESMSTWLTKSLSSKFFTKSIHVISFLQ